MKLARYAKLVKNGGVLYLCHVEDSGLWLGTRYGLYSATGLPETVDSETIMTILDFDSKVAKKIVVRERNFETVRNMFGMNLSDNPAHDIEAKEIEVAAAYKGAFARTLLAGDGEMVFYDEEQLSPLADVFRESDYVQLVVRVAPTGNRYVVIRNGLETVAGIRPIKFLSKEFMGALSDFQARCTEQYHKEERRAAVQAEETGEQVTMEGMDDEN